jgi:hypothetical protein
MQLRGRISPFASAYSSELQRLASKRSSSSELRTLNSDAGSRRQPALRAVSSTPPVIISSGSGRPHRLFSCPVSCNLQ